MAAKKVRLLVANGCHAYLYNANAFKVKQELSLVKEFEHPETRMKAGDLVSDNCGGFAKGQGGASTYEGKHEPHEVQAEHFVLELCKELNQGCNPHDNDEFIVVAPAHFYSLLKKHWNCKFTEFTHVDKDYTKFELPQIIELVHKQLYG